jgi:hypothetical protein
MNKKNRVKTPLLRFVIQISTESADKAIMSVGLFAIEIDVTHNGLAQPFKNLKVYFVAIIEENQKTTKKNE